MWERSRLSEREHPNPDGLGTWAEAGRRTVFMLEHDTGSEHLPQLTGKLPSYRHLAEKMAGLGNLCPLLLFCFPTPRREQSARHALTASPSAPALRIATTAINPEQTSPAGRIWLPLAPGNGSRMALSALDAALPDPWAQQRAAAGRARQEAARARAATRGHWATTCLPDGSETLTA